MLSLKGPQKYLSSFYTNYAPPFASIRNCIIKSWEYKNSRVDLIMMDVATGELCMASEEVCYLLSALYADPNNTQKNSSSITGKLVTWIYVGYWCLVTEK